MTADSDILERAREDGNFLIRNYVNKRTSNCGETLKEAADKIEQLKAEITAQASAIELLMDALSKAMDALSKAVRNQP